MPKPGPIVVLLCAVTLPGVDAKAADDDTRRSWWQTPDQLGAAALSRGEPEAAAALFDDPRWKAAAAYRAGDFERSAASLATWLLRSGRATDVDAAVAIVRAARPGIVLGQAHLRAIEAAKEGLA